MSRLCLLTKTACMVVAAMFFAGCAISYTVKEPVPSSVDYGGKDIKPVTLTIVDKRTGSDSIFLAKVLGAGGSMSDSISLKIDAMEDPIGYFSKQLERELNSRGIPVKCGVEKTAPEGLVLLINKYQIAEPEPGTAIGYASLLRSRLSLARSTPR